MEKNMIYTIKNESLAVEISSLGAQVHSIISLADEKSYIWDGKEHWFKHSPLLFPICGSTTDPYTYRGKEYHMDKHGFISKLEFELVSAKESELVLFAKDNDETIAQYPFSFEFTARYSLDGKRLVSEYTIKNTSGETMPYMFGLHPAFNLHGDAPKEEFYVDFGGELTASQNDIVGGTIMQIPRDRFIENGELHITNEIYDLDTIILSRVPNRVSLMSPYGKVLDMSWSENLPKLCVWKWADDAARFICIEPWSNIPTDRLGIDDFDTKSMLRLGVGETETFSCAMNFA